ncbi:penicillin-binding protein 1A [Thalassobaculum fulvum]|uniref:peptidoglycan glycosyltransferase n=1 Tax=Thalassobaculum fulvum TaxID=1633335 RepID=A0A918XMH3_9PROT|nr:PBP1A family penicillin-binding protein [Thalassobaculum fulvum]GHD38897.1 penicillin-binding protein 1A [Thalassobaculum fulvum]
MTRTTAAGRRAAKPPGAGSRSGKAKRSTAAGRPRRGRPPAARSLAGRVLRAGLLWSAVAGLWALVAVAGVLAWQAYRLPDIGDLDRYTRAGAVRLAGADGRMFASFGPIYGDPLTVDQLPKHLVQAVIATEDRRFYDHPGVDPIGLARAAWTNLMAGRVVQGGSTLTQQLAKNVFLTPDRSIERKIQELLLAFWLERTFGKDEILSIYLNRVYFGAGAYGVDAAARKYFGIPATRLDLSQSALLAGLLKAPSRYNPAVDPERAGRRTSVVLANMVDAGYIDQATARAAAARPIAIAGPAGRGSGPRYFADWVYDSLPDFIGRPSGDVEVATTLDPGLQAIAERAVDEGLAAARHGAGLQAALVALDPATGAVRAMVGGRSYGDSQFNRAVQARRQPGSAFKPVVYLAALEAGWAPSDPVDDAPIRIAGWAPENIDGKFDGRITLAQALARSRNAATVRLQEAVGRGRVRALADRLGLSGPLPDGPSLALGTAEANPLEIAGVYAAFANGGRAVFPFGVSAVRDRDGRALYERSGSGLPSVVSARSAAALTDMLAATIASGTGKAARLDRPAAGKTGTTQDYRDAWFAGYTADLVAVVWVGRDDAGAMDKVTGGGLPADVWKRFMAAAHKGWPARPLPGLRRSPAEPVETAGTR